jgi:D-inositol-3-phosphate glycosyltransferase
MSGLLGPGHDPPAYARALRTFADAPHLTARMGRAAVRHARSFGWDRAAAATAAVYTAATYDRMRGLQTAGRQSGSPVVR